MPRVKKSRDPNHGIEFQKRESISWIIQVQPIGRQALPQRFGKSLDIDLQPHGQGCAEAHARPDSSEIGPGNGLVQLQGIAPENLVPESIEAENLSTLA